MLYFIIPAYGNKVFTISEEQHEKLSKDQFVHHASKLTNCTVSFHDIQPTSKPVALSYIEQEMLR